MNTLASIIDSLPAPQLPEYFNHDEGQIILLAWESARQQARPYDKEYVAPWLLSDFSEDVWLTTNRNREEKVRGEWKNCIRIDWRVRLPDGMQLTDPLYKNLLEINKKIAFLVRSGYVGKLSAPVTWRAMVSLQLQLTRWVVLHSSRFQPQTYGFRLLDQDTLEYLFVLLSQNGWIGAHQVTERLLSQLYQSTYGDVCPQAFLAEPCLLPPDVVTDITHWLKEQGYYSIVSDGVYCGKRYLKRAVLVDLTGEPAIRTCSNLKFEAFCRQFEPELKHETLLTSAYQFTEKPSQKNILLNDVIGRGMSMAGLQTQARHLNLILSAHRHEPEWLPEPALLSLRRAEDLATRHTYFSSHHLFMPVNIGLTYLNEAMRFIHVFGPTIIDYYLAVVSTRTPTTTTEELNATALRIAPEWKIATGELLASALNISGFHRKANRLDFEKFRMQPTIEESLRVLVGACIIVMAILKPSRESELTHLRRDCLWQNNQGYFIHFSLSKQNAGETLRETHRPIPSIMATAIHLLQHLGDSLCRLNAETRKIRDNLFYVPSYDGTSLPLVAGTSLLTRHLNSFCDYVNLPVDAHGRRWYARIHEMRKWFLLLLFWSGRYDVLDAARWIAGHARISDTYAYIEHECPGEELPQLEADYSIDRLRELEAGKRQNTDDGDGLDALYERVLSHFSVNSLTMVPESEWSDYVHTLRRAQGFHLVPHSVYALNGTDRIAINVSFVITAENI